MRRIGYNVVVVEAGRNMVISEQQPEQFRRNEIVIQYADIPDLIAAAVEILRENR